MMGLGKKLSRFRSCTGERMTCSMVNNSMVVVAFSVRVWFRSLKEG
jgi:hypothetical protein